MDFSMSSTNCAEDAEKAGKILEKLLETAPDESKYHAWAAKQLKQMK